MEHRNDLWPTLREISCYNIKELLARFSLPDDRRSRLDEAGVRANEQLESIEVAYQPGIGGRIAIPQDDQSLRTTDGQIIGHDCDRCLPGSDACIDQAA